MKKLDHQQILKRKPSVSAVKKKKRNPIYLILENVRSLHNVGAVFRTADAVLAEKIFLCGITGAPPRKEISKTALGAEELVPWEYRESAVDVMGELREQGVEVVAVELAEGSERYDEAAYKFPVCFVLGHEVDGISDQLMAEIDRAVEVPMLGRANSLNVATCCGIIVFDALRKL